MQRVKIIVRFLLSNEYDQKILRMERDIEIKEILIRDHKKDTLIAIGELNSSIISLLNVRDAWNTLQYIEPVKLLQI